MPVMSKRERRTYRIKSNEILFLTNNIGFTDSENPKKEHGTVGIVRTINPKHVFFALADGEEISMFLDENDLIVCSAFGTGLKYEKAIKSMIYLIREMDAPIVILPKDHPSTSRLKMVTSIGDYIKLDCNIIPGTHPEQNVLCAVDDLSGIIISSSNEEISIEGNVQDSKIETL